MKDLIELFCYSETHPATVGGDPCRSSVGLDLNDGRVYDLFFYDEDTEAHCIVECLKIEGELSYNDVRKLAVRGAACGLVKDAAKYDTLSKQNWREFVRGSHAYYHYVITDSGEVLTRSMPRPYK